MRWGIQPTALTSHLTVDMCLDELDTCSRLSLATNCVVMNSYLLSNIPSWGFHLDSFKSSIWKSFHSSIDSISSVSSPRRYSFVQSWWKRISFSNVSTRWELSREEIYPSKYPRWTPMDRSGKETSLSSTQSRETMLWTRNHQWRWTKGIFHFG